ncbi:MAG: NFACT RNA binding domain-containing protein [Ignavibacteria bacterium]|nr:NFACT RNA binding domain-containing protein [Ignavibacteria bacterium]
MYKSYFYLKRATYELNDLLKEVTLKSSFSQEKDKIVFEFCSENIETFIEVSVNANSPFISLKPDYHRAKKNSVSIFKGIIPQKLLSVKIALKDRIIRFEFTDYSIYFLIRGKFTNLYLIKSDGIIDSFKAVKNFAQTEIANELLSPNYSNGLSFSIEKEFDPNNHELVKTDFPYLDKGIIYENKLRQQNSRDNNFVLSSCINEVLNSEILVSVSSGSKEVGFKPITYHNTSLKESKSFSSYFEAFAFHQKKVYQFRAFNEVHKKLSSYFESELNYLSNKLNELSSRVEKGSRDSEFSKIANLLLLSIDKIRKGNKEIILEDIYSQGEDFLIKLREDFSAQENVNHYYNKARSEKINFEKSKELLSQTKKRFEILLAKKELFLQSETLEELRIIMNELKINPSKMQNTKDDLSQSFKKYIIEEKYEFYVGKDSRSNDQLTMKFAKPNDYWFHARSLPGSHCLLKVHNTKEPIPKSVLKKAASLAAYHSKAKTAGVVPVSYTFKKYVTKKKGMEVGQVILLKEEVLLVKPEIPSGVEFISSDN